MKNLFLFLVFLFLASMLVINDYKKQVSNERDREYERVNFVVAAGQGAQVIADNLFDKDLLDSKFWFKTYLWQTKNEAKIKAGSYSLSTQMSIEDIVDILVKGDIISKERDMKILEGWTLAQIEDYYRKQKIADASEFKKKVTSPVSDWQFDFEKPSFLKEVPTGVDLEGYLFPDTYRIYEDASTDTVVQKMLANFDKKLNQEMRAEIKKQGKSIHDIITMASIIEKEVIGEKDSSLVAGVLYKRLEIGMRLEVDSSVNYATGNSNPSATYADLQVDSPYNTYKHYGLPPGPIANPGIIAIRAAIYPEKNPYLFYLNRQDTGETIFSKTYDEHIMNKNKYLK